MDLLEESSDEETEGFTINQDYADRYEKWRGKEVLQRLKDKHGDDVGEESEDSETEESEDSDAEELTEEVEKDFFKTLACLKAKDPKIYDANERFFAESSKKDDVERKKKPKEEKLTIGDLERKIILEKGGQFDEMEDEELKKNRGKTYVEELEGIKESFKEAMDNSEDDESDEDLLRPRTKTKVEKDKEEEDYKAWLAGQKESISNEEIQSSMSGLKTFWSSKELDEGEKFLKDYLLNKRYKDNDDSNYVPTYDQIVHDSDEGLSEDEENVKKQEEFEHKFNFRFEEPDEEFIKRYPRTIKDSLRQTDDKRKKKRKEVEERKKAEKQQKKEELKMLKSIKKKEILDKLDKLKKITGNEEMALRDEDIDGDFDPAEYDKRMKEIFENYDKDAVDETKPEFSDLEDEEYEDELETEDWDNWTGPSGGGGGREYCEDPDFNMDCDYDETEPSLQQELIENSKGRKKSRRKSKFSAALEGSQEKPVFNPGDKTFEQYVDEYYKLDCEDIIGDLPCRFKYRTVEANDFGLTTEEILTAEDKDLNAWVSLRKTCQYRRDEEEKRDVHVFRNKGKNLQLKQKILPSIFERPEIKQQDTEEGVGEKKKKKRKRNKKKADTTAPEEPQAKKLKTETPQQNLTETSQNTAENKKKKKKSKDANSANIQQNNANNKQNNANNQQNNAKNAQNSSTNGQGSAKKKRNKKKNNLHSPGVGAVNTSKVTNIYEKFSDERLKAYGLNPSKVHKMQRKEKYKNLNQKKN